MVLNKQQHKKLYEVLTKINAAIEADQTGPALNKLEELNTKYPNQPMILTLLGKVNTNMGRYAEAIESFQKTVKLDGKNADTRPLDRIEAAGKRIRNRQAEKIFLTDPG